MIRIPRTVLIIGALVLITTLGAVVAVNLWLMSWVPATGKAWLETQLNQQAPLTITIGAMRYSFWQGFLLDDVRAVDPATATTWFQAPHLQARVGLLRLVLQRQVALRLNANVTAPCDTTLVAAGRYRLADRRLLAEVVTSNIDVTRIIPQAAGRLPNLKDGRLRLRLRVNWQPGQAAAFSGRASGTALLWEQPPLRIMGDAIVEGSVSPPTDPTVPWVVDLAATVEHGSLQGLPRLDTVQEVAGTMRLTQDRLEIKTVRGVALEMPWQLEGTVTNWAAPVLDLTLQSSVALTDLARRLGSPLESWKPTGSAHVTVTCRGAAARWPDVELQATANLHEASWALPLLPNFPHRLERVTATVQYDHRTRRLLIESLTGQVQTSPVALQGSVELTTPMAINLVGETEADLAILTALLPPDGPVQTLGGAASVHVEVGGTRSRPTWSGTATLADAAIGLRAWPSSIERVRGTIRFTDQELSTPQLACVLAGQPMTLSGSVTHLMTTPRVTAQATSADGSLAVDGTLQPDHVLVHVADVTIGSSRLRVNGQVGRLPAQTSHLTVTGTVDLADLSRVPWVDLSNLTGWQPEGRLAIQAGLTGQLDHPKTIAAVALIQAERLSLKGLSVQKVTAEVERSPERLSVRVAEAVVASGKLAGEFILEQQAQPSRYLLEGDLTLADLQQLADAVAAWRGRQLQGMLSAHASLLGVWNDPTSLHGEGWLQAEGERLAEIPLLDRVFRGVFGALADRLGLTTLRKAQIVKVAGQWRVAQQRVWTEDLRVTGVSGTEPVIVVLRGSVGFDKTLDLTVEPQLTDQLLTQSPNTSVLSGALLKVMGGLERARTLVGRHRLSGTIDKPDYKFEFTLDQILSQSLPAGLGHLLDSLR